jgi:hypothetical protein
VTAAEEPQCWFHPDEPPMRPGDYLACGECGHVFRTPADLVTAHLAMYVEVFGTGTPPRPEDHRADLIPLCPICTHDF